jgi:hypothetical protein
LPLQPRLLFAACHLLSKTNSGEDSQRAEAGIQVSDIRAIEEGQQLRATIILGDFNLDPYDPGMVMASHYHGLCDVAIASGGDRTVQGRSYRKMYNPMWSLFGDRTPGPAGTFFRSAAEHHNPHWHIYDQFLLSPEVLARFKFIEACILNSDGIESLATATGRPCRRKGSDHFPILLRLQTNE